MSKLRCERHGGAGFASDCDKCKNESSRSDELVAAQNSTIGAFDGYAGESKEWGYEFVRVVVKVKRADAMRMQDCALIKMNW